MTDTRPPVTGSTSAPPEAPTPPADHRPPPAGFVERQRQRHEEWPDEWWEERVERTGWFGTPLALIVLVAFFGGLLWGGLQIYQWGREQIDPPGDPGDVVVLTLGDGDTASNIAEDLETEGIIPNASVYRWYVRLNGGPSFQAGDYQFQANSAAWDVMDVLESGPSVVAQAVTFPVQFPEGLTVQEIIDRVDLADLPYSGLEFEIQLRATTAYESPFLPDPATLPEGAEPFEGLLFPDTYEVQETESPRLLIERMLRRFDDVADDLALSTSRDTNGLTPYETIILASMIEEEAVLDEERPMMARVMLNRIAANDLLGIDATTIYATGTRDLTAEELSSQSPWNTRAVPGLPPTPIASPGRASLEAALNPAEGDWYYYVRTEEDGGHTFAVTAAEFEAAKAICVERGFGCG